VETWNVGSWLENAGSGHGSRSGLEKLDQAEVDIKVESAYSAIQEFEKQGGKILIPPFDIQIGRCAVVEDPWGNNFVILDLIKGLLKADSMKNVISV
jgi:hypothetical protein